MNNQTILRVTKKGAINMAFICGRDFRIKAGYRQPALDSYCSYLMNRFPELKDQIKAEWLRGWEEQNK